MSCAMRFRFHAPPTLILLITLLLSAVGSDRALAVGQECMPDYYKTKSSACLDGILADFRQNPRSDPNTLTGFLAEIFKEAPEERDRILKAETADLLKSIDLASLWLAGQTAEAQKFAEATNRSGMIERARQAFPDTLDAIAPSPLPRDNDLLIGAYMASGNSEFIKRVLANYSSADDGLAADGIRIGFMVGKFGPDLKLTNREPATFRVACEKYQCKIDQIKFARLLTLATALWSIQSLSQHDAGIRNALTDVFMKDPHMKTIFVAEQTAFGNYLAALVGVTTFKNSQSEDQKRAYAAMDKSASIYENLGPPGDATAAMMQPSVK